MTTESESVYFESRAPPRTNLDPRKFHIIVEIGPPFTYRRRRLKLAMFDNRTPSKHTGLWKLYIPREGDGDAICGTVFSTEDQAVFNNELRAVREIKYDCVDGDACPRCRSGDDMAYTKLIVVDKATDVF